MIPKELIDFLNQLPVGQLEIAYENLTYDRESVPEPSPPTLATKEDMVSLLCSFPYLDLLNELIQYETSDGYSLQSELGLLYQKCSCIESEQALFHSLLRKHHSYGYRMELFEEFAQTIDWLEEPFERIVGVLAQNNVGFLIETNRAWSEPLLMIEVRASDDVSLRELELFSSLAKHKYPSSFETEYCQHTYQTGHYEHPIRLFFDDHSPTEAEFSETWQQGLHSLCSQDAETRIHGRDELVKVILSSASVQRSLSRFVTDDTTEQSDAYPLFERELCTSNSLLSALWLYAYLNIDCPADLQEAQQWDHTDYTNLMNPVRSLFSPIFKCVYEQWSKHKTFETT